ncbi:AAA family ATPase (plasmid) [Bacillus wiedmannii]|uniref:ATP-dependent nuclease n=1 Tax=Bacillus wiedmannii TaxID=1890302 RepID=UPI0028830D16|nr:AAA family ATPase [Bacillus wiedmannii]WMS85112.1 AAA family ATPase [Bacillus wiedmannii]
MEFYVTSYFYNLVNVADSFPCVVLSTDNWDDDGYHTLHKLYYFDENKKQFDIGEVKILHENSRTTKLPRNFQNLNKEYCSLGQDISYYENLKQLDNEVANEIFKSLNDISINKNIYNEFVLNEGLHSSLIRFSQAEKALREGSKFFNDHEIERIFKFEFKYKLSKANRPHELSFNFEEDKHLPFRINAIIGKNGTGKTEMLAKIAALVSGFEQSKKENLLPSRPSFSKVIAISYSVFDEFDRPKETDRTFSYKYCGIRDDDNKVISSGAIKQKIQKYLNSIEEKGLIDVWKKVLDEIFESEHRNILNDLLNGEDISLSSGQNLILMTMTEVIANIEHESLLLFDEPETHLHPNALSNLIRMFNTLLVEFNSFAILSTHSPIIIQEIPSKYINVVERINNTPKVRKLHIESFGENLTTITNEVFDVRNTESNYKDWFETMVEKEMSYDEILSTFNDNLSYNAMTYLNTLFKDEMK